MPTVPISIHGHRLWVFVDSGATFSMLTVDEAVRLGIDWESGRRQMIVVGDGSYIPTFIHDLPIQIGRTQVTGPIGFSERLGVGFNLLGRTGVFDQFEVCFNAHLRKVTFQPITSAAV
jgi:predicted aspartyl protease